MTCPNQFALLHDSRTDALQALYFAAPSFNQEMRLFPPYVDERPSNMNEASSKHGDLVFTNDNEDATRPAHLPALPR